MLINLTRGSILIVDATLRPEAAQPIDSAAEPLESGEGVDLSLVRAMLALSPSQRLDKLRDFAAAVTAMRHSAQLD